MLDPARAFTISSFLLFFLDIVFLSRHPGRLVFAIFSKFSMVHHLQSLFLVDLDKI
jgi:hypothetical protein